MKLNCIYFIFVWQFKSIIWTFEFICVKCQLKREKSPIKQTKSKYWSVPDLSFSLRTNPLGKSALITKSNACIQNQSGKKSTKRADEAKPTSRPNLSKWLSTTKKCIKTKKLPKESTNSKPDQWCTNLCKPTKTSPWCVTAKLARAKPSQFWANNNFPV